MSNLVMQINTPGLGEVVYPYKAMDVGTRAFIDTTSVWAWGGSLPAEGATISGGQGPKNNARTEDGWADGAATVAQDLLYSKGE
nr:hypothetical protein [Marinicella sp. W31]MDC2878330.1 hypothetical protein [Marinicella sp. W31]